MSFMLRGEDAAAKRVPVSGQTNESIIFHSILSPSDKAGLR